MTATAHEPGSIVLLVATRKGAWLYHGDAARRSWRVDGPHFLGHIINHLLLDPRDGRTLLAAAKTGHLGPTIFRSTDLGATGRKLRGRPPSHRRSTVSPGAFGRSHLLAGAGPRRRARRLVRRHLAAGTVPLRRRWRDLGAVLVHQRRPAIPPVDGQRAGRHAGRAEAAFDHRRSARPAASVLRDVGRRRARVASTVGELLDRCVDRLQVVEGFDRGEVTFHDPHCLRLCPSNPDRLYQQNHCGIYRLDRPATRWRRIGRNMPAEVGDIGFPMVVHPRDDDTAWVLPMDGSDVWPRTSPGGRPAVYATRDGGENWQRHDAGLPASEAWWTVKRQAMCADRPGNGRCSTSAPPAASCG
jgi:hypothetical protein